MTIVGEAGVGKSRLVAEALVSLDGRVVQGRCLPYGEGITYWPAVDVLKQLDVPPPEEAAARAIRSLLGEAEVATSAEEIAWAFRKTLEHAAAERPLVVVFDDIQWGEETFLDLIEHVALLSSGAAILLLCMARPELLERRPAWPVTLRLDPLGAEDVERADPRAFLRRAARRGSPAPPAATRSSSRRWWPWPAEEEGDVVVPPTLQALLAARLDQLEPAERSVLERGAVEGEIFHRGAVQALAPEETQVTPRLAALVRKGLIRPVEPQLAGEDGFRFRHLLIRDAAYDALPKARRAELHERFADWFRSAVPASWSWMSSSATTSSRPGVTARSSECRDAELGRGCAESPGAAVGARRAARTTAPRRACRACGRAHTPGRDRHRLEADLGDALVWGGRATRRSGAPMRSARGLCGGRRVGELCGRIQER